MSRSAAVDVMARLGFVEEGRPSYPLDPLAAFCEVTNG